MRNFLTTRIFQIATASLGCLGATQAEAHVKWFCAFDVAGQPVGLENVLCTDFELLTGIAMIFFVIGCLIETTSIGAAMSKALSSATAPIKLDTEILIRAVAGFFFVALWTTGGIMLTPELKTDSTFIPWFQLAIATGLIWRSTMGFSGVGIFYLFLKSVTTYGGFHLMDYPIFLGLASYLILTSVQQTFFNLRPLDVFRIATSITLMWASVEKWAYPEWSFPLFLTHPTMAMGYDPEFFMRAAGVIEFTLAFALLWTPLVRRLACVVLLGMFVTAINMFGKIDAIGHAPIIVVLLAIIADDVKIKMPRYMTPMAPFALAASMAIFIAVYYLGHSAAFGTAVL